jgi:hypothetical protein
MDIANPYRLNAQMALLALTEHPQELQAACFASGCESWEMFEMALDLACSLGWLREHGRHAYEVTAAGDEHARACLDREHAATAADRLTAREASAAHADLTYQHALASGHPLSRKLWLMMFEEETEPLTAEERAIVVACVQMQTGPARQSLIDKLMAPLSP